MSYGKEMETDTYKTPSQATHRDSIEKEVQVGEWWSDGCSGCENKDRPLHRSTRLALAPLPLTYCVWTSTATTSCVLFYEYALLPKAGITTDNNIALPSCFVAEVAKYCLSFCCSTLAWKKDCAKHIHSEIFCTRARHGKALRLVCLAILLTVALCTSNTRHPDTCRFIRRIDLEREEQAGRSN
jgi:hypothetical protein